MNYKIVNNSLYLCDNYGNIGRRISENVSFGTFDDSSKVFLITLNDGTLVTRDYNGNPIRTLFSNVLEARFNGDLIIARLRDGRNVLIDRVGNIKRYI